MSDSKTFKEWLGQVRRRLFIDHRAFSCAVCGVVLAAQTDTTEDPEAPELIRFVCPAPWIGIVDTVPATLLVICSTECKDRFFEAGG